MSIKSLSILLVAAVLAPAAGAQTIRIKGSADLLPVMDRWAAGYAREHAGAKIIALGGGTTLGFNALGEGTADLVSAERAATEADLRKLKGAPIDITVGTDAILFVVNPKNLVKSVTLQQLQDIYSGKITNWSALGGENLPISAMALDESIGRSQLVRERVMQGKPFGTMVRRAKSEHDLLAGVWQDRGAIAFSGMALGKDFPHLAISKEKGSATYAATADNIKAGRYPLTHAVRLYANADPSAAVRDFVAWAVSPTGQNSVAATGIAPISAAERDRAKAKIGR